jgi:nicotinamide riboside kinase
MKVINLFGGPGVGKSTIAADLFALMKCKGASVELVNEYAKEVTWEGHLSYLDDEFYILAHQNRRLVRLKGKVDYVITDSPVLLGLAYTPEDYYPHYFSKFIHEVWNSYDNINIVLQRESTTYTEAGRNQRYEEALQKDRKMIDLLDENGNKYIHVHVDRSTKYEILGYVNGYEKRYNR